MTEKQLDLSGLAIDRSSPAARQNDSRRPARRWFTRYAVPGLIIVGFLSLVIVSAGSSLSPSRPVTVVPVMVKRGTVQQAGTPLFQAAGWIEPRPTAISVASLTSGVIESLDVVEGQPVRAQEPIARLISIDAELEVEQAQAVLAIEQGALKRAEAEFTAAKIRFEQPLHLQVQLADAKSLLAKARTEFSRLPYLVTGAQSRVNYAQSNASGKRAAGEAVAERIVQQAESERAEAVAELDELRGRKPLLQNEIDALQDKVDALQSQLDQLTDERQQMSEAEAKVLSAKAVCDQAELNLKRARLNLQRTIIRAPVTGRVLRLIALPGTRVSGLDSNGQHDSSTVVEMYDPNRLQVRADVRLEDVPLVKPGAPVEIETASSGSKIQGRVLRSTSLANIQKNTLEVKVELLEPPETVSPEMLVTAIFMSAGIPKSDEPDSASTQLVNRLYVPDQLVENVGGSPHVWIVNAEGRAIQVAVETGKKTNDGLVEISSGLNITDKLISSNRESLQINEPVKILGEDITIGIEG